MQPHRSVVISLPSDPEISISIPGFAVEFLSTRPVVHGAMGCGQTKLSVNVAIPPAPVRVHSQRPLAQSVASVAKDKGDLLAFALWLRKTSARRRSDEGAVRPVIASNKDPFLQMRSVGSHSKSGREKEGKKEGEGKDIFR